MAIWCFQVYPDHLDIVDYYEGHGQGFDHYCGWLHERRYHGADWMPHDAKVREVGAPGARTRIETLCAGAEYQHRRCILGLHDVQILVPTREAVHRALAPRFSSSALSHHAHRRSQQPEMADRRRSYSGGDVFEVAGGAGFNRRGRCGITLRPRRCGDSVREQLCPVPLCTGRWNASGVRRRTAAAWKCAGGRAGSDQRRAGHGDRPSRAFRPDAHALATERRDGAAAC
jgi:hypothetical protein